MDQQVVRMVGANDKDTSNTCHKSRWGRVVGARVVGALALRWFLVGGTRGLYYCYRAHM